MSRYGYDRFPPYVPVAQRKKNAMNAIQKLKKKGQSVQPVMLSSKNIANTFWGKAWCTNLESYSDYENRLERGRTYVRNGFVIDLQVGKGQINAMVIGSSIYKVKITITPVTAAKWDALIDECSGKVGSVIELLQGKLSQPVMEIITHPAKGLFPAPKQIKFNCNCPDDAYMCKHVAAVLYGVGARLDERPEELFLLREADHLKLFAKANVASIVKSTKDKNRHALSDTDLSSLFGIDIAQPDKKNDKSMKVVKTKKSKPGAAKKTPKKKQITRSRTSSGKVVKKQKGNKKRLKKT